MPMRGRTIILAVVSMAAAIGIAAVYYPRAPARTAWQGYAEADYVKIGPTQQGLLTAVNVVRGGEVEVGTKLFAQDETADRAARDQAARQLQQAKDQLANLESESKPTEIDQAEANLTDARATVERTKVDLERALTLVKDGAVTMQTLDQRRADFRSATARVAAMEAALAQARAPMGRAGEIKAQRAGVEAAQAALEMAEWRLSQRDVSSPVAGRVADVLARPGETMGAGAPVVSLLPPGNIFVRFFVPEVELGRIHRGDPVRLDCDGCRPGIAATISFVSPQAEYTPPVIYSEESRAKLVYLIEARPSPGEAALFNPGQPVSVSLAAEGAQP
ncbi:HlyD family secretion protein [Bradyrhizobium sp. GCM10027634]|uniref:HlyD family secretion protein n=1 Tax=unclassified Bradyrhizobium TaxID=2631580 RepID=UPI00188B2EF0|nr:MULTISPECIES: HlyD family efflux transporter periplasmic adaptor subunit [unclassified Bradyrhizobium]MDN5000758.1 HlyD family efflux transporter periplasmic adaptor subunit [Bradyrhizobium sp. WYCCWR 12677]QOZ42523.1 secretion protein HylD [Bradyrhizobium sp. CCBAU 53340]